MGPKQDFNRLKKSKNKIKCNLSWICCSHQSHFLGIYHKVIGLKKCDCSLKELFFFSVSMTSELLLSLSTEMQC